MSNGGRHTVGGMSTQRQWICQQSPSWSRTAVESILPSSLEQERPHIWLQGPDLFKHRNELSLPFGVGWGLWRGRKKGDQFNLYEDAILDNSIPKSQAPHHS